MAYTNERFKGFGAALQKSSAKKKLKKAETEQPEDKEKKTDWKKWFRLGSGGRSKTSAQE